MENLAKIQCDLIPSNPGAELGLEIWFDADKIFDSVITDSRHFEYRIDDDIDSEHELKFVLKNKTDQHTIIDDAGNIVNDSTIQIENLKFEDIELGHMFNELSQYTHDNNGHGETITQQFFGTMGCNGTVSLKFATPIYLWMLENM